MKVVQLQMMESKAGMPAQVTQCKWFETITKLQMWTAIHA